MKEKFKKILRLGEISIPGQEKRFYPVWILTVVWLLGALVVRPFCDFPLNDDFSYARSVHNLAVDERFEIDNWGAMTLVAQVFWGAGFVKLFGFSFTALRVSTLVIGWLASIAFYYLVRAAGQPGKMPYLVTILLIFNPLWFSLANTFMTDVHFSSWLIFALLFYDKAFRTGKAAWVLSASLCAVIASFIRQPGIMLSAAFALAWLWGKKTSFKSVAISLTPLIINLLLMVSWYRWLAKSQGIPEHYGHFSKLLEKAGKPGFLFDAGQRLGVLAVYMGVFLSPLLVWFWEKEAFPASFRQRKLPVWMGGLFLAGLVLLAWNRLPFGNMIFNLGIGPRVLKDGYYFQNVQPGLRGWELQVFRSLLVLPAFLLIYQGAVTLRQKLADLKRRPFLAFLLINVSLYVGFLLLDVYFFDRYYLPLLPLLVLIALPGNPPTVSFRRKIVAGGLFLTLAVFSIGATHDYHSWNKARWKALDWLTGEQGISPNQIDGGFEFNGWHRVTTEMDYSGAKSWWWIDKDDYAVTFGDIQGYVKIKAYPFYRFLPPERDSIFILKRK